MQFVDVVVRQAHPGPAEPPYQTDAQKRENAAAYQREESIFWPVVVDDLEGTVHQAYGTLADPTYLVDADGRVAYYNMWTYAPVLHQAIAALVAQNGRGVVLGQGVDRVPHMLPSLTTGWRGLRRGLPQSLTDIETAAPGLGIGTWLGYQLRPLLAPLTQRAEPLPVPVKIGLGLGAAAAVIALSARQRRR